MDVTLTVVAANALKTVLPSGILTPFVKIFHGMELRTNRVSPCGPGCVWTQDFPLRLQQNIPDIILHVYDFVNNAEVFIGEAKIPTHAVIQANGVFDQWLKLYCSFPGQPAPVPAGDLQVKIVPSSSGGHPHPVPGGGQKKPKCKSYPAGTDIRFNVSNLLPGFRHCEKCGGTGTIVKPKSDKVKVKVCKSCDGRGY